jgi:hypothetical protein
MHQQGRTTTDVCNCEQVVTAGANILLSPKQCPVFQVQISAIVGK